jgi:hypothetical protein
MNYSQTDEDGKQVMIELHKPEEAGEQIGGDRRSNRRYDISLALRWKLLHRKKTVDSGRGHTVDLSTSGIMFETGRKMPVGAKVQLSIAWPALLHNTSPLQLSVAGRVVRSDDGRVAIEIIQHEFRTAGVLAEQRGARSAAADVPFAFRASACN